MKETRKGRKKDLKEGRKEKTLLKEEKPTKPLNWIALNNELLKMQILNNSLPQISMHFTDNNAIHSI